MIQFKQKEFWVGLAISAAQAAGGLIQGAKANKINQENAEAQLQQQKKMDRERLKLDKQNLEMNRQLAKAAGQDPMAAATALQGQQKLFTSNKTVKEGLGFAKNLAKTAEGSGIGKRIVGTAAIGALGVGASYAVDKAIQRNAKKSGFAVAHEDTEEDKEARKKSRRKRALKLGALTTAAIGGTIAAKKGALGEDIQKAAENINKENLKKLGSKVGKYAKSGIKETFIDTDENGKKSLNYLGTAITGASLAMPIYRYATSKKQLKEQMKQSEENENEKEYSEKETPEKKAFLFLLRKKARKLPRKVEEKTYSVIKKKKVIVIKKKPGIKEPIETKIFKTYLSLKARGFSKVEDTVRGFVRSGIGMVKNTKDNVVKTAKSFKKRPGTTILDLGSKFKGGGGLKRVNSFGRRLQEAGEKSGNTTSQKVGKFIKENPKTALLGSIVVGTGIIKAGQSGYNKTRKFIEDHDKNAFAYEKSQGMIVPRESKDEEDDN